MRFALLTLLLGLSSLGCANTGFPEVIDARDVPSALGSPHIDRIRDLGGPNVPVLGSFRGQEDGIAGPGELILIEGSSFGKQPTVSIGGRATTVVARTEGGGIIARVPGGVIAGETEVSVAQAKGKAMHKLRVRRLAVVVHDGRVDLLDVGKEGVRASLVGLHVPGAKAVRLFADGSVAYLIAQGIDHDRLVTIDLAAAGGPQVIGERMLNHRAQLLVSAADAPVVAILGEGKLTLFSTSSPRAPAPFDATELPKELAHPRAAELSPDGKVLVLLYSEGNKLTVLDVEHPPLAKPVTTVDLLPDQKLPLVRDLSFSSDGETLWVVSGDNAESLPALEPTRLTALRLMGDAAPQNGSAPGGSTEKSAAAGARLLSLWRTQTVPGAAAPLKVAIARGQPLASGTTIRMPPEKAAVFVTSVNDALFKLREVANDNEALAKAFPKLWKPPQPGMMVRADINGGGGPMFATPQILASVDVTPDAQWILATCARVTASPNPGAAGNLTIDFGVTASRIWGPPVPEFIRLGSLRPEELKPPFQFGDLRIQP